MKKSRHLNFLWLSAAVLLATQGTLQAQGGPQGTTTNQPAPSTGNAPEPPGPGGSSPTDDGPTTPPTSSLEFSSTPILTTYPGENYKYMLSASGGISGKYFFSATKLPSWLSLNAGGESVEKMLNQSSLNSPGPIAIDAAGTVYVIDLETRNVHKVEPDGTTTEWFTLPLENSESNPWYSGAVVVDNYLYVADFNSTSMGLVKYNIEESHPEPMEVIHAYGFGNMVYRDGFLYVCQNHVQRVVKIDVETRNMTVLIEEIADIQGLSFTNEGDLLLAQLHTRQILKYSNGHLTPVIYTGDLGPSDVRIGTDGYIYIARFGAPVLKVSADYESISHYTQNGYYPLNLILNHEGNLVFPSSFGEPGVFTVSSGASVSGQPTANDVGEHEVILKVEDGEFSKEQTFTITVVDNVAPNLVSNIPLNSATDVPVDTKIKLVFNEKINAGTGNIIVNKASSEEEMIIDVVSNAVSIDDKTVTITLPNNLSANTTYIVSVPSGTFKDDAGNLYGHYNNTPFPFLVHSENSDSHNSNTSAPTTTVPYGGHEGGHSFYFTTVKKLQTITFAAKDTVVYGVGYHMPNATASSEMHVHYTSSDESVAEVTEEGQLIIKKTGEVNITAYQEGGNGYVAATPVTQTLTVLKKEVTAFIINDIELSKTYDGNTALDNATEALLVDGTLWNDHVWVSGTIAFDNKNVGTDKTLTASDLQLQGESADNYMLKRDFATAKGEIKPRVLKVYQQEGFYPQKSYDGTTTIAIPADKLGVSSVVEGEHVTVSATGTYDNKNAGSDKNVIINDFVLGGTDKANYTVSTTSRETLGTILPVPLTVTAESKTKKQGDENPSLTVSYSGFVGGDKATDLEEMPELSTTAASKSAIGYYDITISGGESHNYVITRVNGQLTVVPGGNTHIKAWSDQANLTVRIYSEVAQKSTIILYSEIGQPIIVQPKQLQAGVNTVTMSITPLTRGFYVLNVNADKFKEAQRVKIK